MYPPLYRVAVKDEIGGGDNENLVFGLSLQLAAMGCYTYPRILTSAASTNWILPRSDDDETKRDLKMIKRTISMSDLLGDFTSNHSSSGNNGDTRGSSNMNSLPRLHFRDHIWTYTQRYLAAEAVEEAAKEMIDSETHHEDEAEKDGCADGMRLVQLLIACAEAVACRDKSHASNLLSQLRSNALVFGSSFQRVASCFVQGLADRLALIQTIGAVGSVTPIMNIMDKASAKMEEAYKFMYEICPHIQFGHFVANSTISEVFEGQSFLHVVDLGMSLGLPQGHQWRALIQDLAFRAAVEPVRRLRITGVGLCIERLKNIGEELEVYAKNSGINLEFSAVQKSLENLQLDDVEMREGEVLVVNSILQLHCVVKESRGALNSVLQMIHKLSPKVFVMVEHDSSHNGPFFLGRFMEALHYYSAIFDSLDALLPKYDTKRAKIEQFYLAEEIKNIVSCEGAARVERHERLEQWRRRMSRARFQAAPIKTVAQAKQWLQKKEVSDGYTVVEEKGCLVIGWKSKPIVSASCWKCKIFNL